VKPFLKWAGGKGKLIPQLLEYLPYDFSSQPITYIEPFIGGGAMLFFILRNFTNVRKAVINDINTRLIATYRTIKRNPQGVIDRLAAMQGDFYLLTPDEQKDYYMFARQRFNSGNLDDEEVSAHLIFLNHTCFNGLYRENAKGEFNVPFGRYTKPVICDAQNILSVSRLLQKVEILQGDFQATANYIDENTFFYLDPPYRPLSATSNFNSYSGNKFGDEEQERLKHFCDTLDARGCRFLLSNADCKSVNPEDDFFDYLYRQYQIHRISAARSINANPTKRGKLSELLICNYRNTASNAIVAEGETAYKKKV